MDTPARLSAAEVSQANWKGGSLIGPVLDQRSQNVGQRRIGKSFQAHQRGPARVLLAGLVRPGGIDKQLCGEVADGTLAGNGWTGATGRLVFSPGAVTLPEEVRPVNVVSMWVLPPSSRTGH